MAKNFFIFVIIIVLGLFLYNGIKNSNTDIISNSGNEDIETALLQVKAKVKVISDQALLDSKKNKLKGEKLNNSKNEQMMYMLNSLKEKELIVKDDKNLNSYYVWDRTIIDELELNFKIEDNHYLIVNYETLEVIVFEGIHLTGSDETLYKLTDVEKQMTEKENDKIENTL